jgi:hypothetical protein
VNEDEDIEQLYITLRNQIRDELGFLALSPSLLPTPEELEELSKEIKGLE